MEVKAIGKFIRVQPRKVRIVADEVRGNSAVHGAALLRYHNSKGAYYLRKVLISAIANAVENNGASPGDLRIATIMVDEGPRMKRMKAGPMGRGRRIIKKTSHITVVLDDTFEETNVRPHGAKPKARPTFAAPKKRKGGKGAKAETPTEAAAVAAVEAPAEEIVVEAATAEDAPAEVAEPTTDSSPEEAATESGEAATDEAKEDKGD